MVEPEIWTFLDWIASVADGFGLTLLPEVHDRFATHERLAAHGFWTYDFVLPGLVLHALTTGEASRLAAHLDRSPERVFTTLDCHDGIPVRPDLDEILEPAEMLALTHHVQRRGGNVSRLLGATPGEVDVHQLNITYWSALDADPERYLAARAIQLFARGVPQVYYVGLLAGANDLAAVAATNDGRAINRHDYDAAETGAALERPVVRRLLELIRLRNTHPAFDGTLSVETDGSSTIRLAWSARDSACALDVDLASGRATVHDGARAAPRAG
jgi:sucrose phosphorylase